MKLKDGYTDILKGEAEMPPYFFALAPLGWAYAGAMRLRESLYRSGVLRSLPLPCKVVSVGNLTAGGTGKTPMVSHIARRLSESGLSVAVLTRGYGGRREGETLVVSDGKEVLMSASDAGDEPVLLAGFLPGVPVVMGADRHAAGMLAVERFSPGAVVVDDGFQHMRLKRDLDLLLLDARRPFGNGSVMPAGYLREPVSALGRADIVVLTRSSRLSEVELQTRVAELSSLSGGRPVTTADHRPVSVRPVWDGTRHGLEYIAGRRVYVFCGIADPASFALILKGLGANIVGSESFSDHHLYTGSDLKIIEKNALKAGAEMLVTTDKDAVRLTALDRPAIEAVSVSVELVITGGGEALEGLLMKKVLV